DELRAVALVVREADLDRGCAAHHVVVRDDVAGAVDNEARPERALGLRRPTERIAEERVALLRYPQRRLDMDDAGRRGAVDLVDRLAPPCLERGRRRRGRVHLLADDRRLVPQLPQRGRAAERNGTTDDGGEGQPGGAAWKEGAMHPTSRSSE